MTPPTHHPLARLVALTALAWLPLACAAPLPVEAPPLHDMEEPVDLLAEPDDEAQRQDLPVGSFSGAYVERAQRSLEAELLDDEAGGGDGVLVARVVENSPADAARIAVGDILLERGPVTAHR